MGAVRCCREPPQHREGKDHVTVLAAHVDVAQAVVSDIPDEVGDPLQVALIEVFVDFHFSCPLWQFSFIY